MAVSSCLVILFSGLKVPSGYPSIIPLETKDSIDSVLHLPYISDRETSLAFPVITAFLILMALSIITAVSSLDIWLSGLKFPSSYPVIISSFFSPSMYESAQWFSVSSKASEGEVNEKFVAIKVLANKIETTFLFILSS